MDSTMYTLIKWDGEEDVNHAIVRRMVGGAFSAFRCSAEMPTVISILFFFYLGNYSFLHVKLDLRFNLRERKDFPTINSPCCSSHGQTGRTGSKHRAWFMWHKPASYVYVCPRDGDEWWMHYGDSSRIKQYSSDMRRWSNTHCSGLSYKAHQILDPTSSGDALPRVWGWSKNAETTQADNLLISTRQYVLIRERILLNLLHW